MQHSHGLASASKGDVNLRLSLEHSLKLQRPLAGKLCRHGLSCFSSCHQGMFVCRAASKIWEDADVPLTDAYTWGKVDVPSLHGHVVQVAAGKLVTGMSVQSLHEYALGHHWLCTDSSVSHSAGYEGIPPFKMLFCNLLLGIKCVWP